MSTEKLLERDEPLNELRQDIFIIIEFKNFESDVFPNYFTTMGEAEDFVINEKKAKFHIFEGETKVYKRYLEMRRTDSDFTLDVSIYYHIMRLSKRS